MNKKINVLIVDDHPMVCAGLVSMLSGWDDIEIVETCSKGDEALDQVVHERVDIVLMDLRMPEMSGFEVMQQLATAGPSGVKIVALSILEDKESIKQALASGASGYLLKQISREELHNAILRVCGGEFVFSPEILDRIVHSFRLEDQTVEKGDTETKDSSLTAREQEIASLLRMGLSNQELADRLHISPYTVKTHLKNLYRKLGVKNRAQAILRIGIFLNVLCYALYLF